jgi:hypothetical protein
MLEMVFFLEEDIQYVQNWSYEIRSVGIIIQIENSPRIAKQF